MKKIFKGMFKILLFLILLFVIVSAIFVMVFKYTFNKEYSEEKIRKIVDEKREEVMYTKLNQVDKKYIDALIATEDHRFYEHNGIDRISILRAITVNFKNKKIIEGGSTISQQLIKNLILDQNVTVNRKIKEAYLTLRFEKMYSKDDILELYMNTSYFGSGYYNILSASIGYFGKMPNDLTKTESVFLAGVPNAPAVYDPRVNEKKAHQRRNQVLSKMVDNNVISEEEAKELSKEKIKVLDKDKTDKMLENIFEQRKKQQENKSQEEKE